MRLLLSVVVLGLFLAASAASAAPSDSLETKGFFIEFDLGIPADGNWKASGGLNTHRTKGAFTEQQYGLCMGIEDHRKSLSLGLAWHEMHTVKLLRQQSWTVNCRLRFWFPIPGRK